MRIKLYLIFIFICSMAIGAILGTLLMQFKWVSNSISKSLRKALELPHEQYYTEWLRTRGLTQARDIDIDLGNVPTENVTIQAESVFLLENVRTICWVMLNRNDKETLMWPFSPSMSTTGKAISHTWGKRCNKIIYFTNRPMRDVEFILLKAKDLASWTATYEVIMYLVAQGYLEQFDWFLRAEEDTFVIMENLAYYLSVYNATMPCYFGHPYRSWGTTYNSDGPGYVVSVGAMKKLYRSLSKGHCQPNRASGDAMLGRCLLQVGVEPVDTRDNLGRARFLSYMPEMLLVPGNLPWSDAFWRNSKYISAGVSVAFSEIINI